MGEPEARREALERGADSFLPARVPGEELLAILKGIGRRYVLRPPFPLASPPVILDPKNRIVRCGAGTVALTPTEFAIATYLFRNPGRLVLAEELATQLRRRPPGGPPSPRRLHVHLVNLRKKLSRLATGLALRSVRGKGILLDRRPAWSPRSELRERRPPGPGRPAT